MARSRYDIVKEEDDFIIVNKPAGLLSIPGRYDNEGAVDSLQSLLKRDYKEIYTVHRLDKDTSGLMIFAKNADAHKALNLKFEHNEVIKTYIGIAEGILQKDNMTIDQPIAKDLSRPGCMKVFAKGKPSISHITVKERFNNFTLIEVKIETGRTHQIRVHMQYAGHPLVSDPLYGIRNELYIDDIKKRVNRSKFEEHRVPLIKRTALHAYALSFQYKGIDCEFSVEPPKDIRAAINQIKKHGN